MQRGSFLFLLALIAGAAPLHAQAPVCPHERAENVPAHIVTSGAYNTCVTYLSIFGIDIPWGRTRCPMFQIIHPAHQECRPAAGSDTRCVQGDVVQAQVYQCQCTPSGPGPSDETCTCTGPTDGGTILNWKTVDCETEPPQS